MNTDPFQGCLRQVHLDFHNSPYLDDLLSDFDPKGLARQFKEAGVNSVVVFTKCVHGMGYYPSKIVTPHPALRGRDFTGEMIEALHAEGIRAPLYTIIAWEENLATTRPEWMQFTAEGSFAQLATSSDNSSVAPGRFHFLNFLHPDYQDYFAAHLDELLERYLCDGLFLDMLVVHPRACWSETSIAFREQHGLMGEDTLTHLRFETEAQKSFAEKFSRQIRGRQPDAAIFYNAENRIFTDATLGTRARAAAQTHFEIESLPGGFWGYRHFPRVARALAHEGLPWLGMTGRFQKMWGDFGGVKPVPALEFECFRAQALGGANSVGDQLHPRGTLDRGGLKLIKEVFTQCAAAEVFYAGSVALPRVAIVCPHHPLLPEEQTVESEEGAILLCQEEHYDCAVVTDASDLSGYELIILPDDLILSESFRAKINAYHAAGGKVLASFRAGLPGIPEDPAGLDFLPVEWEGRATRYPNYWRAGEELAPALGEDDRVVYLRGANVRVRDSGRVLIQRVLPYFQRSDLRFTSHFQAPPMPGACPHPALVEGEGCFYFADPIFRETRRSASPAVRDVWRETMRRLIGPPAFGAGLKSTIRVYPRRKGEDLLLTLLHYIPKRKTHDLDVIDERMGFAGQILRLPAGVREVMCPSTGEVLEKVGEQEWVLPAGVEGRLLLRVPVFFVARETPA